MLQMCGLPNTAGDQCFPKQFREIFKKHIDTITKVHLIPTAVERSLIIDNAEVPLYPTLTKTIIVRDYTGYKDLGKRAAWVNAAKGLSPCMRYANLLHTLFSSQSLLYLQMYRIMQALRDYLPAARYKLSHTVKSCILWIILLQSRQITHGKMVGDNACLGEFNNMINLNRTKNCETITQVEVPATELLAPTSSKRKGTVLGETPASGSEVKQKPDVAPTPKKAKIVQPSSPQLKECFEQPLKDAGNPVLSKFCEYSGITH